MKKVHGLKGRQQSEEHKKNRAEAMRGKKLPIEIDKSVTHCLDLALKNL